MKNRRKLYLIDFNSNNIPIHYLFTELHFGHNIEINNKSTIKIIEYNTNEYLPDEYYKSINPLINND